MDKHETTVLLVDDEPNILIALEFLIQKEGYRVLKAQQGAEALQLMQLHQPEIVVLDVMMPEMDGFEVARKIRSNEAFDKTRIIFLSAKGTQKDRLNGYANGGEIYLTKPFDNQEVLNTINEVVEFGLFE
ncbi:MAG TPA: response regulator [Saprospiraceae bacterium]|nr:response regulator [Saprospiraceae bacterium]HMQ85733.1 response regulator [Saprospiraceae bacterium]